jgi:hypothetical protein
MRKIAFSGFVPSNPAASLENHPDVNCCDVQFRHRTLALMRRAHPIAQRNAARYPLHGATPTTAAALAGFKLQA